MKPNHCRQCGRDMKDDRYGVQTFDADKNPTGEICLKCTEWRPDPEIHPWIALFNYPEYRKAIKQAVDLAI